MTSLVGTALAAAVHVDDNKATIHLYYQHENITLRELILAPDESTWSDGEFTDPAYPIRLMIIEMP